MTTQNENIKMSNVRLVVSFFATSIIIKFLEAPEKGVPLDTKTAKVFAESSFDFSELPNNIFADCASSRHGLKQKLVDSLAMNKDTKANTSIKESQDSLTALWSQLKEGNWNSAVRGPSKKGETVKLSDMEKQFLAGVTAGTVPYEQAAMLYKQITGKELPKPEPVEEESQEEEVTPPEQP